MTGKKKVARGQVIESLPGTHFKVVLEDSREIIGYLSGRMRISYIRVVPGDWVQIELSTEGDDRGRIIRRM